MKLISATLLILVLILGCSENDNPITPQTPDANARYRLTFTTTWSAQTHPTEFPANAHFSGLIGMTHNDTVMLFSKGELASEGIKNMAETGSKNPLEAEIQAFISNGSGNVLISGAGVNSSPGEVSLEFNITSSHSLVSVVSMLAPSPDWFIAVSSVNLIGNNEWVNKTITVEIYDAGTDNGSTFLSPDFPSLPPFPIDNITTPPLAVNNVVAPLGSITFTKID